MRKLRILITGASGLLGLNTALEATEDWRLPGWSRPGIIAQVNNRPLKPTFFETVQADLLAPGAVRSLLDRTRPDWVIHCAALADIDACERDPQQARELNSDVPQILAMHVARSGARLLHVSTDAVFDGRQGDYKETDQPNPLSVYARTKLEGELAVASANPDAIVARVNLFGWSLSGKRSLAEFFFNNLSLGRTCMGFTDVFFCPMLVNDLGALFFKMLDSGLSGLFHAVGSECISKYEFGRCLARAFGFDEDLVIPTSVLDSGLLAARSPNLILDTHKLSQVLGEPLPGLSAGLTKLFNQYQAGYPHKLRQLFEPS